MSPWTCASVLCSLPCHRCASPTSRFVSSPLYPPRAANHLLNHQEPGAMLLYYSLAIGLPFLAGSSAQSAAPAASAAAGGSCESFPTHGIQNICLFYPITSSPCKPRWHVDIKEPKRSHRTCTYIDPTANSSALNCTLTSCPIGLFQPSKRRTDRTRAHRNLILLHIRWLLRRGVLSSDCQPRGSRMS